METDCAALDPAVPKVQFREAVYSGEESDGQITVTIYRNGDIRHKSTIRCYSRQGSAEVASDFDERPNTDASVITFLPGASFLPTRSLRFHLRFGFFFSIQQRFN